MKNDRFRLAKEGEILRIFRLIQARVQWMDEVGIRQWNVTDYSTVYPLSYYEEHRQQGELFVLTKQEEIVCVGVLKHIDDRWKYDGASALYLHNFASKLGEPGVGKQFLQAVEQYAVTQGKQYIRLDSAVDNEILERYYTELGFKPVGFCTDGLYRGVLRQKALYVDFCEKFST